MQVVVTGGSGFIGSHVVDRLAEDGHDVVVVDTHPPHRPDVEWRPADIADLSELTNAFDGAEVVFHLAAVADVNVAFADPIGTVDLNVAGTARVCEACRRVGVRRVVLASTVWVYGAAVDGEGAVSEDVPFDLARSDHLYTSSKLAAEMVVRSYQALYGLDFTILRYGIPYGTRMRESLVIPKFVKMGLNGDPITLQGDGSQFRNYVYVEDLARAHSLALSDAAANQVFNLEGTEPVTIRRLVDEIGAALDRTMTVETVPARAGDYEGRPVSAAKAERMLGWKPRVSFADGLDRYVKWHMTGARPSSVPDPEPVQPARGGFAFLCLLCLLLPLLAAFGDSKAGLLAGAVGTLAAGVGYRLALKIRPARSVSLGAVLLAIWLLSQTGPGPGSAVVGLVLGAGIAGLLAEVPLGPLDARPIVVLAAAGAVFVLTALFAPHLLWWAAVVLTTIPLLNRVPHLELSSFRTVAATGLLSAVGFVALCTVGATSASAAWFGPVVTHGSRANPQVALTFHGTTDPQTFEQISTALQSAGANGTFFFPGSFIKHNQAIAEQLLVAGDLLAGYPYRRGATAVFDVRSHPVGETQASFNRQLRVCPRFMRPPAGYHTPFMAWAARGRGLRMVTWDQLVSDGDIGSPAELAAKVADRTRPGSIVAINLDAFRSAADRRVLVESLPILLHTMHERALAPVRVDQLLAATPYGGIC